MDKRINIETERAAFEASGIAGRLYRNNTPGSTEYYEDSHTQMAWRAWQASAARFATGAMEDLPLPLPKPWLEALYESDPTLRSYPVNGGVIYECGAGYAYDEVDEWREWAKTILQARQGGGDGR